MIIQSVELENIRSYERVLIQFNTGSTLLSGDIGSGKSTIFQAIEFALFGISRDVDGASLLRSTAKRGVVKVTFQIQQKTICVTRNLSRTKHSVQQEAGSIEIDGVREDLSATELKTSILDILKYPNVSPKILTLLFRYTVYCSQEQMKHILQVSSDHRLELMRALFDIDQYKRIRENALLFSRKLKEDILVYTSEQSGLSALKEDVKTLTESIQTQKNELQEKSTKQTQIRSQQTQLQNRIDELVKQKEAYQKTQLQKEHLQEQMIKSTSEITRLQTDCDALTKTLVDLSQKPAVLKVSQTQIQTIQEQIESLSVKQSTLVQEQKYMQEQKAQIHKQLDELSQKSSVWKKRLQTVAQELSQKEHIQNTLTKRTTEMSSVSLQDVEAQIESLIEKKTQLAQQLADLESQKTLIQTSDTCPTCNQSIDADYSNHVCTQISQKVETLKVAQTQIQKRLEDARIQKKDILLKTKQIEELQTTMQKLSFAQTQYDELHQQIQESQTQQNALVQKQSQLQNKNSSQELTVVQETLHTLREQLQQLQKQYQEYQEFQLREKQLEHLKKQVEEKKNQIQKEQELIQQLQEKIRVIESQKPFDQTKLNDLRTQYEQQDSTIQSLQLHIQKSETSIEFYQTQLRQKQEMVQEKQHAKDQLQLVESYHRWLNTLFIPLMQTIEQVTLQTVLQEFSDTFSGWFSTLIEDESIQVRLDSSFTPIIIQNGCEMQVSQLSGGERTSIALAYRLAVNNVLNKLYTTIQTKKLLLLDEPTDGFSTEQLDRVRTVLQTVLVDQLLIVSHEAKIESFVDNVLRIQKEQHKSVVLCD